MLPPRLRKYQRMAEIAGEIYVLDPMLILAIMDRESLAGEALKPKGPTGVGDQGHGHGLMQIDDRSHHSFVTLATDWMGTGLWARPEFNILYGAGLLRHNMDTLNGDVAGAVAAYNCGLYRAKKVLDALAGDLLPEAKVEALDQHTTGHDYVKDVLKRRDAFTELGPQ